MISKPPIPTIQSKIGIFVTILLGDYAEISWQTRLREWSDVLIEERAPLYLALFQTREKVLKCQRVGRELDLIIPTKTSIDLLCPRKSEG